MNYLYNISIFIIPFLLVYIPSIIFPIKNSGKNIPFRPPGYIFIIIWPILLLLISFSWSYRKYLGIYYLILSILLGIWIILYYYSNVISFIELILVLVFTIFLIFYRFNIKSSLFLIPLSIWLIFACILNGYEIFNN